MTSITARTEQQPFAGPDARIIRSRPLTIALWVVTVPTAAMFLMAGVAKLTGAPLMVQLFDTIGIGQWFRYLTGTIEVVAAVTLLVPSAARYGALALVVTMIGAILTHLLIVGGSPAIPLALLIAASFIAWARGSQR